jgi:prevent-host-death family protein
LADKALNKTHFSLTFLKGFFIMTTTMTTVDAKEKFTDLLNHVAHTKERVIIVRRGKEIAALVPLEDLRFLETTQNKEDLREAIDALKEVKNIGSITLEKLKEEIGTAS